MKSKSKLLMLSKNAHESKECKDEDDKKLPTRIVGKAVSMLRKKK